MSGASSERNRKIVYQARDIKSFAKPNEANSSASEPIPIRLDDDNKENDTH